MASPDTDPSALFSIESIARCCSLFSAIVLLSQVSRRLKTPNDLSQLQLLTEIVSTTAPPFFFFLQLETFERQSADAHLSCRDF